MANFGRTKVLAGPSSSCQDISVSIAKGELPGYSVQDKFGRNPEITAAGGSEDIWEYGGLYTYTADAGATYYVSSSDVTDTQPLIFYVLTVDSNGNWNDESFTQVIAGQTQTMLVPDSGDPIVRIYRIVNDATAGNDLSGIVYVYESSAVSAGVPSDSTKVRAIVDDGNNQTLMALYTIPTGKVGFLYSGEVGLAASVAFSAGTEFANVTYRSRRYGKVFTIKKNIAVTSNGNSNYADARSFPDATPAKTDVRVVCDSVSATMGVWATFDFLLIDEDDLDDDFLTSIGQIRRVV